MVHQCQMLFKTLKTKSDFVNKGYYTVFYG